MLEGCPRGPLELTKLTGLMHRSSGSPAVKIGLIDGPVSTQHPDLASENLREISGSNRTCKQSSSIACIHGTYTGPLWRAFCQPKGVLSRQLSARVVFS